MSRAGYGPHAKIAHSPGHAGIAEELTKEPATARQLAVPVFSHGSLAVELYTPVGHDPQKPHTRDEVYFVARRRGWFLMDGGVTPSRRVRLLLFPLDR